MSFAGIPVSKHKEKDLLQLSPKREVENQNMNEMGKWGLKYSMKQTWEKKNERVRKGQYVSSKREE